MAANKKSNKENMWAAVVDGRVVKLVSMKLPASIGAEHYDEFAAGIRAALQHLGSVHSGVVVQEGDGYLFKARLTHANRSKKPRVPKIFLVDKALALESFINDGSDSE